MGHSWVSALGWVATLATCLFAWAKGGAPERRGAALLLVSEIAGDIIIAFTSPSPSSTWLFLGDLGFALGLLFLAVVYSSIWLGVAMLLQSIILCIHGLALGGEGPEPFMFMAINNAVSIGLLACIVAATAMSWWARPKASVRLQAVNIGTAAERSL